MLPFLQLPRIFFEFGAVSVLPDELAGLGISRPVFVTDGNLIGLDVYARVRRTVPAGVDVAEFCDVPENPTTAAAHQVLALYRARDCNGIVAIGGGSVIDCAKAAAFLVSHPGNLGDYLGRPDLITSPPAPLVAIPTTAGTGSEVSRGCGIHPDPASRAKGINHPSMVPKVAICDPELTLSLPPRLTAGTGMDALSHCIEGFLAKSSNPLVDALALDGVHRLATYIERAVQNGQDREARSQVMMAALQGGISIYKGLGPAHAVSNTCGDRGLHHGVLTTLALPAVLRLLEPHARDKMRALGQAMGCAGSQTAADAVETLNSKLGLPKNIGEYGYGKADLDEMTTDVSESFFNRPSPYHPTRDEYRSMLEGLLATA